MAHLRLKLVLPEEKVQQITIDCRKRLTKGTITAQELASVIGRLSAAYLTVLQAPLYIFNLQHQLIQIQKSSLSL